MERNTGIDEDNIIIVRSQPFSPDFKQEAYLDDARQADLAFLRSLPGVHNAEAITQIPLSGSGSSGGYKPLGSKMQTLSTAYFTMGTEAIDTLGIRLLAGRTFNSADINDAPSKNVLVTKAFADALFPNGDALGKQIQGRTPENPHTIVGILEKMHGSWPRWRWIEHVTLIPGKPGNFQNGIRYLVRTERGQRDVVAKGIETQMLKMDNGRNVIVGTLADTKAHTYMPDLNVARIMGAVIVLLLFVTALGIVGITSFSVTERTRQIGTRRAIGARRLDILRYFLTENWMITSLGVAFGVLLAYGLNYYLMHKLNGTRLDWLLVTGGIAVMWLISFSAALFPALRGTRITPAIATRTV
jgi:putative ABC transport system permease protein